jgi:hypothetical protein
MHSARLAVYSSSDTQTKTRAQDGIKPPRSKNILCSKTVMEGIKNEKHSTSMRREGPGKYLTNVGCWVVALQELFQKRRIAPVYLGRR